MTWLFAPVLAVVLAIEPPSPVAQAALAPQDVSECLDDDMPYCLIPTYCWSDDADSGDPLDTCPWVFADPKEG